MRRRLGWLAATLAGLAVAGAAYAETYQCGCPYYKSKTINRTGCVLDYYQWCFDRTCEVSFAVHNGSCRDTDLPGTCTMGTDNNGPLPGGGYANLVKTYFCALELAPGTGDCRCGSILAAPDAIYPVNLQFPVGNSRMCTSSDPPETTSCPGNLVYEFP